MAYQIELLQSTPGVGKVAQVRRLLSVYLSDSQPPRRSRTLKMWAQLQLLKDLREQHTAWVQRIHAILLHQAPRRGSGT